MKVDEFIKISNLIFNVSKLTTVVGGEYLKGCHWSRFHTYMIASA